MAAEKCIGKGTGSTTIGDWSASLEVLHARIALRFAFDPDTYRRLVALKDKYDPDNVFCLNQNIKPSREQPQPVS